MEFFYNTISPHLKKALDLLMDADILSGFRLVGGTCLSLQLGHRKSEDIDLFTEAEYGSVDFSFIEKFLRDRFAYVEAFNFGAVAQGKSYFIGDSGDVCIKLDVCYTDPFIRPVLETNKIRLAKIDDIVAMKVDVVGRGGRKKDFWDLHELFDQYSLRQMIDLHKERYPFNHNKKEILSNFTKFENADADFDPICLRGKHWELIKLDILDEVMSL